MFLPFYYSFNFGAPEGIRTPDLLIRSQALYPAELRAHIGFACLSGQHIDYTYFRPFCQGLFANFLTLFYFSSDSSRFTQCFSNSCINHSRSTGEIIVVPEKVPFPYWRISIRFEDSAIDDSRFRHKRMLRIRAYGIFSTNGPLRQYNTVSRNS